MKWIGQRIVNFISRFRNDVYLEDISTGTIASGSNLGLDSNNKIVKAAEVGAEVDLTSEVDGILPVANGGTGATSFTDGGILIGDGTSRIVATSVLGDGEILIGDGATDPVTLDVGSSTAITILGTIATGTWQGTAIARDYIADDAITFAKMQDTSETNVLLGRDSAGAGAIEEISPANLRTMLGIKDDSFEFEGFSVGDGTNYMIPEINSDTKAPFEHQTSTGSDGLTATAVITLLRTSGHVMPHAGTLKLWKGWATSSGTSQTVDIGLYKVTLVNNDATAVSPVALKNTSFTSVGNTKALTFSETSFSVPFAAGDILISAVRNGTNAKRCDFTSTLVVEWTL